MAEHASEKAIELFVPGRLCIIGEHSDWAGAMRRYNPEIVPGRTLVVGTEQGLYARAQRLSRPVLVLRSTTDAGERRQRELPLDAELLAQEARNGGFWSYAAGVAYKLLVDFAIGGLLIDNHRTTLPLKKGLSSSAALCVLLARAYNRAYNLQLTTRGEMELAYVGERLTPSQCGRMDQAVAFGSTPVLMTYDADLLFVKPVTLGAPLHFVLVDLRASKDTVVILESLQEAYPHPTTEQHKALVRLLGEINQRLTEQALHAMQAGDAQRLGALMSEAQREFDAAAQPLCPSQLASPRLHAVLEHAPLQSLIWGGKGVGSQGDGTAQLLCRDAASQAEACRLLERDLGVACMPFTVPPTTPAFKVSSAASASSSDGAAVENAGGTTSGVEAELQAAQADLRLAQQLVEQSMQRLAGLQSNVLQPGQQKRQQHLQENGTIHH